MPGLGGREIRTTTLAPRRIQKKHEKSHINGCHYCKKMNTHTHTHTRYYYCSENDHKTYAKLANDKARRRLLANVLLFLRMFESVICVIDERLPLMGKED